eukprot:3766410-Amphidinium_carterae.1
MCSCRVQDFGIRFVEVCCGRAFYLLCAEQLHGPTAWSEIKDNPKAVSRHCDNRMRRAKVSDISQINL